jgi:hypothetical protein
VFYVCAWIISKLVRLSYRNPEEALSYQQQLEYDAGIPTWIEKE